MRLLLHTWHYVWNLYIAPYYGQGEIDLKGGMDLHEHPQKHSMKKVAQSQLVPHNKIISILKKVVGILPVAEYIYTNYIF